MTAPIKLALVGGSGTGKSTLLNRLQEQHKNNKHIAFVHESARQFFSENKVDVPFDFANQEKILDLALLNEKLATEMHPKIIVTDTSALEAMFYTAVQGNEKGAEHLLKRLETYIPTYTKFLVMNPDDVIFENDEIRREDKATRDRVHQLIIEFYQKHNLRFELISGTIPERQKRVNDIINTYLTHA